MALAGHSLGWEQGKSACGLDWEMSLGQAEQEHRWIGSKEAALAKALKSSDTYYLLLAQIDCTQVLALRKTSTAAAGGLEWWERNTNTPFTETGNQHPEQDRVPQAVCPTCIAN